MLKDIFVDVEMTYVCRRDRKIVSGNARLNCAKLFKKGRQASKELLSVIRCYVCRFLLNVRTSAMQEALSMQVVETGFGKEQETTAKWLVVRDRVVAIGQG